MRRLSEWRTSNERTKDVKSVQRDIREVTMEENIASGGFGEHIAALLEREGAKAGLLTIAIENRYVEHGDVETLRKVLGIDADTITQRICEEL